MPEFGISESRKVTGVGHGGTSYELRVPGRCYVRTRMRRDMHDFDKKKNLMSFTAVCAGNRGHGLGTRTAPMPPRSQGPGASSTPRRGRNAPRGEATSQCSDVPRFCKKTLRTKFGRIQIWVCSLLSYVSYVRTYGTLSLRVSYHTDKDTNEACEREARAKYS